MKEISSVLEDKKKQLLSGGDPLKVTFSVTDINELSDVNKLRILKLSQSFPQDFQISKDVFDCAERVIHGDSIYRVLEFCMLRNRVLVDYVTKVFSALERDKV